MALLKAGTGIGTTSPQSDLHVEGNVKVTGISTFNNNVSLLDDNILRLGDGNDLMIFHNTNIGGFSANRNYFVNQNSRDFEMHLGNQASFRVQDSSDSGNVARFVAGGAAELYHDGSKKFETIGAGVTVAGDLHVSGDLTVAGSKTSVGSTTFTGSAGTPQVVDEFTFTDLDAAEYTLKVGFGTYTQVQKVLLMTHDATTTAYTEEYGIMYQPSAIVSIGATVSAGNCQLRVTPVTGVSGVITCKFQREGIS